MNGQLSSQIPPQDLERRAAEQRARIHRSVGELKSSLTELKTDVKQEVRERLDPQKFARKHLWQLAAGASAVALVGGYGVAGMFTRR
jgi:ElaB/YqjD/DUF883 family membrane-anchored ribosome-binding protein